MLLGWNFLRNTPTHPDALSGVLETCPILSSSDSQAANVWYIYANQQLVREWKYLLKLTVLSTADIPSVADVHSAKSRYNNGIVDITFSKNGYQ